MTVHGGAKYAGRGWDTNLTRDVFFYFIFLQKCLSGFSLEFVFCNIPDLILSASHKSLLGLFCYKEFNILFSVF